MNLSTLVVKLDADIAGLQKGFDAADRAAVNLGKTMQRAGGIMSAAVTLPLTAVGVAATKMASDAEEAANKFAVVMGDSADRVNARLKELHATIPLTTAQMQGLAAGVQDLLVPMGVVRSEAADMSANMVGLAGDLGSFNNVAPDQVLEAMKSALAGSSEPMRRFGVDTREAALQAIALDHGLIEAGETMNSAARAQAVLLAIQKDSTDAMGDAARTVDSTANSFKFLVRDAKELAITFGNILIPVVTPLVQQLTEVLGFLQDLSPAAQKVVVAVAALAAAAGPLLFALGTMATLWPAISAAMTVTLGPAALALAAFTALAAAAYVLIKNWDVVKVWMAQLWAGIKGIVFRGVDAVLGALDKLTGWIPGVGDKVGELRESFNAFAAESLAESEVAIHEQMIALGTMEDVVTEATTATDTLTESTDTAADAAKRAAEEFQKLIEKYDHLSNAPEIKMAGEVKAAPVIQRDAVTNKITGTGGLLDLAIAPAVTAFSSLAAPVEGVALTMLRLRVAADDAWAGLKNIGSGILEGVGNFVSGLAQTFNPLQIIATVFNQALREAVGAMQPLIDAVQPLVATIASSLAPAFEALAPVIQKLSPAIAALATGFSGIIIALAPVIEALVPVINLVVRAFSYLLSAIGYVIKGLGWLIDKLLGWATDWGDTLEAFGEGLIDAGANARAALDSTATSAAGAAEAVDAMTASVTNAVRGFKVAPYRFAATQPSGTAASGSSGGSPPTQRPTAASVSFTGDFNINTSGDGRETYRNFYDELDQRTRGADPAARALFHALPVPA